MDSARFSQVVLGFFFFFFFSCFFSCFVLVFSLLTASLLNLSFLVQVVDTVARLIDSSCVALCLDCANNKFRTEMDRIVHKTFDSLEEVQQMQARLQQWQQEWQDALQQNQVQVSEKIQNSEQKIITDLADMKSSTQGVLAVEEVFSINALKMVILGFLGVDQKQWVRLSAIDRAWFAFCRAKECLKLVTFKPKQNISDQGLQALSSLANLQSLDLFNCSKITHQGLHALRGVLSACKILGQENFEQEVFN